MWTEEQLIARGFHAKSRLPLKEGIPLALAILEDPQRIPYVGNDSTTDIFPDTANFVMPLTPNGDFSTAQVLRCRGFLRELETELRISPNLEGQINITHQNSSRIGKYCIGPFLYISTLFGPTDYLLEVSFNHEDNEIRYYATFEENISGFHRKIRLRHLGY